jgi:hypothetical protein
MNDDGLHRMRIADWGLRIWSIADWRLRLPIVRFGCRLPIADWRLTIDD